MCRILNLFTELHYLICVKAVFIIVQLPMKIFADFIRKDKIKTRTTEIASPISCLFYVFSYNMFCSLGAMYDNQ